MNIKKIITGIMASALMACSLSAFSATADYYPIKLMKGDVNGDGSIDVSDQTLLALYLTHQATLSKNGLGAADVNWDNDIDLTDVSLISAHIAKKTNIHTGDANGDRVVSNDDVQAIRDHIAHISTLSAKRKIAADIDGNGVIDVTDLNYVSIYLEK